MSWARNGLALAPLPHEDTPLPWPDRQDRQHLQSADDSFQGTPARSYAGHVLRGANGSQNKGWVTV